MSLRGCFVTGTDTNVGKTRISTGLLHWLMQQGVGVAGLKPVAAGVDVADQPLRHPREGGDPVPFDGALLDPRLRGDDDIGHGDNEVTRASESVNHLNEDVQLLQAASSIALTAAQVGPCVLAEPCAPTIAAALEGRVIDRKSLHAAAHALAAHADFLVIEGVGGFCVPLGNDWDSADLAVDFALPVVLVVGLRLGCINHALLSAEAITRRGLRLAGWMGNTLDANLPWYNDNLATLTHELTRRHQAPCLGVVPWLEHPAPATVAQHFNTAALQHVFF